MEGIQFWMVVVGIGLFGMCAGGLVTGSQNENHNGEHHATLCGLLGAAVEKWKTTNHPGVKKVLGQAIFGKPEGGDPDNFELPQEYQTPGDRRSSCGDCRYDKITYPGKSIPHDLLCLCTLGRNGHPFQDNGSVSKLCGKEKIHLECESGYAGECGAAGGRSKSTGGKEHVRATWHHVVKPCLQKKSDVNLEGILNDLTERVKNGQSPKWASSHHYDCGGESGHHSLCVGYNSLCATQYGYPQWYEQLAEALRTPNLTEDQLNSSTFLNTTIGIKDSAQPAQYRSSTQTIPSTTSTSSTTEESPGRMLPLLSNQQSGTSLTHPLLCLASASSFI